MSGQVKGFDANATVSLAVTSTSANVAFGAPGDICVIQNTGSKTAYIKRHTISSGTAAVTDTPLQAGATITLSQHTSLFLSAICAGSDTTTLYITSGSGAPDLTAASGTSSSSTVTSISEAQANAAAPTLMEGTNNPLSSNLAGGLRVVAESGTIKSGAVASGAVASGAYASGAISSGAVASGAYAAGSIAAGAYVSGSILSGALASGAVVDITNMQAALAAASAPTKAIATLGIYNSTAPTPSTGQTVALQVNASGFLLTKEAPAATGTNSSVASSSSAVTVLAANAARLGAAFFNESTQICYLILSTTTPTSSAYTVQMAASSYYEIPNNYTGIVKGIWVSANGSMRVTEFSV